MAPALPQDPFRLCLKLAADPIAVRATLADLMRGLPIGWLNEDQRSALEIVLAEVLNNIVEHAYAERPGVIDLQVSSGPGRLWCEVSDCGREMPGGKLPAGQLPTGQNVVFDLPVEDLPEGGFGWFLIRHLTQDLQYQRQDNVNRLTFSMDLRNGAMVA